MAWIAFIEFDRPNTLASNEFLLFISNKWNTPEIIIARQIIHKLFVKNYRDKKSEAFDNYDLALCKTSNNVLELSRESGKNGAFLRSHAPSLIWYFLFVGAVILHAHLMLIGL